MHKKTALLFGATGLTGTHVLKKLIKDDRYGKVVIFTRSDPQVIDDKTEVIKTPLEELDNYKNKIKGDDIFCCLGTTIKKAGSKENFRKVDYEFPVMIARIAEKNKVPNFLIISSIGADPDSSNFYLRTKGLTEKSILEFGFKKTVILRPSMLLGERKDFRLMEEAGKVFMYIFSFMFIGKLKKYRGIKAEKVAGAMIKFANTDTDKTIYESHEINNQ